MILKDFQQYMDSLLATSLYKSADVAINGIQLGDLTKNIQKVAFAVDACAATIETATAWKADLLFVHHGLFWGSQEPITGPLLHRISGLVSANMALYASHLPLDAHMELGNNIGLARVLGLNDCQPFGRYRGIPIGVQGTLPAPLSLEEISQILFSDDRSTHGRLAFGKQKNQRIAIVSGAAANCVSEAVATEQDLFITGEPSHPLYHYCQEASMNVIFGGHYQTEIWGVATMAKHVREQLGLETIYFDLPTGL
jgi:dinuclear metal center YbgI/SA1388 family protein